jgi:hypothetical protein
MMLFCAASAASAQTIVIRSGDHGTFTRLALDMPYRVDWRMEPRSDGASINFPDADLDFDASQVFDRIGRNRLRALEVADGQLHLDFACDCGLQAFWHADRMLVLDIAESFPSGVTTQEESPTRSVDRKPSTTLQPLSTATSGLSRTLNSSLPQREYVDANESQSAAADDMTFDLSIIREQLLQDLGRAANQGLLTPKREALPEPRLIPAEDTVPADAEAPAPETVIATKEPRQADSVLLNLRARSSFDNAVNSVRVGSNPLGEKESCVPKDWLDLPSWAGSGPFHLQVGDLNRQLLGEFDRPDDAIALKLARLYLHHGFGAEARHILELRAEISEQDDILREMARIMDRGHAQDDARLATIAGCGEPAVLWALLARPSLSPETVFDHKALLRAFAGLPAPLRDNFGPELARRLIEARHSKTARDIIRMTERTGKTGQSDLALARANLAEAEDDQDTAMTQLDTAIANNASTAPEALAQLIEGLLAKGTPVPLEKAELAGAYAFENRGTALGRRMTGTYLAALGAAGAFAKAVSEFHRLRPDLDETGAANVAASLMQQMTRHADDVTFLRHAMSDHLVTPDMVEATLGADIAQRLLDAGFADRAASFVAADLPGRDNRTAKLIRAEIALMRDRPRQAEVELLGLDGPDANSLRARARSLVGDHSAAQSLYAASDRPEQATQAAWFAQDLDRLADAEDPVLRQAADILGNQAQRPNVGADPSLAHHRDVLESASSLRTTMERLLDAKGAPEASRQ